MPALDMRCIEGGVRHPAVTFDLNTGLTTRRDPKGVLVQPFPSPGQSHLNVVPTIANFSQTAEKAEKGKKTLDLGMEKIGEWEAENLKTDTWTEVVTAYQKHRDDIIDFCKARVKEWNSEKAQAKKDSELPPPHPYLNLVFNGSPLGEHPVFVKFFNQVSQKTRKGRTIKDPLLGSMGVAPEKSPRAAAIGIKLGPNLSESHEDGESWGYRQNEQMPLTAEGVIVATEFFDALPKVWLKDDLVLMSWTDKGDALTDFHDIVQCSKRDNLMKMVSTLKAAADTSTMGDGSAEGQAHILIFRKQNVRMKIHAYDTVPKSKLRDNLVNAALRFDGLTLRVLMQATTPDTGKREPSNQTTCRWVNRLLYNTDITKTEFEFVRRDYLSHVIRGLDRTYVQMAQEKIMADYVEKCGIEDMENTVAFLIGKALAMGCYIAYKVDGREREQALEKRFLKRILQHPESVADLHLSVIHLGNSARAQKKHITLRFYNEMIEDIHERMKVESHKGGRFGDIDKMLFIHGFVVSRNRIMRKKTDENESNENESGAGSGEDDSFIADALGVA